MSEATFRRVASIEQIGAGKMLEVQIEGKNLVICNTKDGWHALDNTCTHAYAKMSEGRLRGHRMICPLHGASFDCRSGAVLGAPAILPLKSYPVRCSGKEIEVEI